MNDQRLDATNFVQSKLVPKQVVRQGEPWRKERGVRSAINAQGRKIITFSPQ